MESKDDILDLSKLKDFVDIKTGVTQNFRKHCGKRIKCWLPIFSPFPTRFSKAFFLSVVKSQDCEVEG